MSTDKLIDCFATDADVTFRLESGLLLTCRAMDGMSARMIVEPVTEMIEHIRRQTRCASWRGRR